MSELNPGFGPALNRSFFWLRGYEGCPCEKCLQADDEKHGRYNLGSKEQPLIGSIMVLCPTCGNKRCPHAADHENACTNSNESGQPGSSYPKPRI